MSVLDARFAGCGVTHTTMLAPRVIVYLATKWDRGEYRRRCDRQTVFCVMCKDIWGGRDILEEVGRVVSGG